MIFTYEKRLITYKKWFYVNFILENLVVVEFCHESNIKNFITCFECDLKLNNWKLKRRSITIHERQSFNCSFVQKIVEKKLTSNQNDDAKKIVAVIQKIMKQKVVAAFKQNSKIKRRIFFESFKFEEFTISFSSTSIKLRFESIIKSNVVFVANSIFISISKSSKLSFSSSISFCSTSTILLINQSICSFIANIMFYIMYENRLIILKNWFHIKFNVEAIIVVDFNFTSISKESSFNVVKCFECDLILNDWKFHDNSMKKHYNRIFNCSFFDDKKTKKVTTIVQKIKKQKITIVVVVAIEAAKSETCVKNINFFDFTMILNLFEFCISVFSANFLHHLIEIAVNYQEKSIIKILFQCLRDSALTWFKDQFKFTSLNNFETIITKIFSFSTFEFVVNFDRAIIDFSSQKYHTCL